MIIRPIIKNDDQAVAQLIRQSLRAYDLDKPIQHIQTLT